MGILGTVAAVLGGALLVGYCVHFDRTRRSDPDFKAKLRERRRKQKAAKEAAELSKIPDLQDAVAVQKFYLEETQLGEELLAQGDFERGVDHMTNAIAVVQQPHQAVVLKLMEQALPPPAFQRLFNKLPAVSQRIAGAQSRKQEGTAEEWPKLPKPLHVQDAEERAELPTCKPLHVQDAEVMQRYFHEEIRRGRELWDQGDCEKGMDHMTNAIAVVQQLHQAILLKLMEQALPPPAFLRLLNKLPGVSQHIAGGQSRKQETMAEEWPELPKPLHVQDAEAMQRHFHEEIRRGRELWDQGDCEKGVDHLSNAFALCADPQQTLRLMQKYLPPSAIEMLLTKLKLSTISQPAYVVHVI